MSMKRLLTGLLAVSLLTAHLSVQAETRVTYKSAKSTSSYYQMGVQIAEGGDTGKTLLPDAPHQLLCFWCSQKDS